MPSLICFSPAHIYPYQPLMPPSPHLAPHLSLVFLALCLFSLMLFLCSICSICTVYIVLLLTFLLPVKLSQWL